MVTHKSLKQVQEEIEKSATFGRYASEFSSSSQNHTGKLYSEHQLKNLMSDFLNRMLASPSADRQALWESFINQNCFDKNKSMATHVLNIFLSIDKHVDNSQEIQFYQKMLNDEGVTKEVLQKIKKARDACYKIKGYMAGTTLVNLDNQFLSKSDLITLCKKNFPDKQNLDLDIVHWVRDQKNQIVKLKKTNKSQSNSLSNNIKNSDPSVSLVLKYLTDVLVKDGQEKNERIKTLMKSKIKEAEELIESEEKGATIEKENSGVYVAVNSFDKTARKPTKEVERPFEEVRAELVEILKERRLEKIRQTQQLAHEVNEIKANADVMMATMKLNDPGITKVKTEVGEIMQIFNDIKTEHSGSSKFMRDLFTAIGMNGFQLFNEGTQLDEKSTLYTDINKKLQGSGNKYYGDINQSSKKLARYMDNNVLKPYYDLSEENPEMFKPVKNVKCDKEKAYKETLKEFYEENFGHLPSNEEDAHTQRNKTTSETVAKDTEKMGMLGPKQIRKSQNIDENPNALKDATDNMVYLWKARDDAPLPSVTPQNETPAKNLSVRRTSPKNLSRSPYAGNNLQEDDQVSEESQEDDLLIYKEDEEAEAVVNFDDVVIMEDEPVFNDNNFDFNEIEKQRDPNIESSKLTVSTTNVNKQKEPQSPLKVLGMQLASSPLSNEKTLEDEVDFDHTDFLEKIQELDENVNLNWTGGEGHYGKVQNTKFDNLILNDNYEFKGTGTDNKGEFDLLGTFDPSQRPNVELHKVYNDIEQEPIKYVANLDANKNMLDGEWQQDEYGNGFRMYADQNQWTGALTDRDGASTKLQAFLNVTDNSINGLGNEMADDGAQFLFKGFIENGKDVKMIRFDLDGSEEKYYYQGKIFNGKVIKGKFKNEDKSEIGKFRIKYDASHKQDKDLSGLVIPGRQDPPKEELLKEVFEPIIEEEPAQIVLTAEDEEEMRLQKKWEAEAEQLRKDQERADEHRKREKDKQAKREAREAERQRKADEEAARLRKEQEEAELLARQEAERLAKEEADRIKAEKKAEKERKAAEAEREKVKEERSALRRKKKDEREAEAERQSSIEEAEAKRQEQEEAERLAMEEAERIRAEQEAEKATESERKQLESERKIAEAEREKAKEERSALRLKKKEEREAEALRQSKIEEEERQRQEKEEAERLAMEEAERIRAEQEAEKAAEDQRKTLEVERKKKLQEREAEKKRVKEEREAAKARKAQEEADRLKAEEEERIKQEKEMEKIRQSEERDRKRDEEKKKKQIEDEKKQKEEEKKRKEEEKKKKAEEDKKKADDGKGLVVKNIKSELNKLKPKEDPLHNVLYTFINKTKNKLRYYMITPEDPMRNHFELQPGEEFTEDFTIQFDWIIQDGNNQIALYNPLKSLPEDAHVTLCTVTPNRTTEEVGVQDKSLSTPVVADPETRAEDFKIVLQEDKRELAYVEKYLNLEKFDKLIKITNSDGTKWDKAGNFKNKRCIWRGKLAGHQLTIDHMEFTFENQVTGFGDWYDEKYNIEGEISEKGDLNVTFVFTHSHMRFTLEGRPTKQNMFEGVFHLVEDARVDHKLVLVSMKGQFSIKLNCESFNGSQLKNGIKLPLNQQLNVDEQGIFGYGFEEKDGLYFVRGDYDFKKGEFTFVKNYAEGSQHPLMFKGSGADIGHGHYLCGVTRSCLDSSNSSHFKMKGELETGPFVKKKVWWSWGANHNMNAVWDGWYTVDGDKTKYAMQVTNIQFAFFDYIISGSGEDEGGKYTIEGTFNMKAITEPGSGKLKESHLSNVQVKYDGEMIFDKIYSHKAVTKYQGMFHQENKQFEGRYKKMSKDGKVQEEGSCLLKQGGHDFECNQTYNYDQIIDDLPDTRKKAFATSNNMTGAVNHQRMVMTANGILGIGDDELGPYIIKGDFDFKNRTVVIAQNYLERRSYVMVGRFNIHKGKIMLRGLYEERELTNRKIVVPFAGGSWDYMGKFGLYRHMNALRQKTPYDDIKDKMHILVDHGTGGPKQGNSDLTKSVVQDDLNKSQVQKSTPLTKSQTTTPGQKSRKR